MGKQTEKPDARPRATGRRSVRDPRPGVISVTKRRGPSRVAKANLRDRIRRDTASMMDGSFLDMLKKQGYEEVPLEELQDRLSKLRDELAPLIVAGRG